MKIFPSFTNAIEDASYHLEHLSHEVHTSQWQSTDISNKPEMSTYEVLGWGFKANCLNTDLDFYRQRIKPNLPWADKHFETERVSGKPINPGETYKEWPWGNSADKFKSANDKFSHTYAERYWPKLAEVESPLIDVNKGIRYRYGDLDDLVLHLLRHPLSRQAYLPVWFPEDTGVVHAERVPCSLGYHFIRRGDYLHCSYWLRSCDFYRHFRDDIYLTIRLQLWILAQCKELDPQGWGTVQPGMFSMWITSLHCFKNDYRILFNHEHRLNATL